MDCTLFLCADEFPTSIGMTSFQMAADMNPSAHQYSNLVVSCQEQAIKALQFNQPLLSGNSNGFRTIASAKLAQNGANMKLDRALADDQLNGNLFVL